MRSCPTKELEILTGFCFSDRPPKFELMKLSSFRTFLVFICSVGLISYVVAGPGASGVHGPPADAGSGSGPGFNQNNNPGQLGQTASDGTRFDSQDNPGKSGSAFGRDTADNAGSKGSSHQNSNAIGRGETVTDTSDRGVGDEESSEKGSEGAESDKTFKASLMDTGLNAGESPSSHGTPGQPPSGTPPGKHLGWEKGKNNPHKASPSPSATASASASASASATATATATATPTP